jgi:hypothetical protein
MDLRDLFKIGEPTKVFIENNNEIIELQPTQELGYRIINLDTPVGGVRNNEIMIVSFLNRYKASDIDFIDAVIQKIQSLRFIELTTFLEFHFNALRPSLKRSFLKFIQLYILDNEEIKESYRDSIKVWYEINEAENKIYEKDKPTKNWNEMVGTYKAFFANCNFDYGIEAFNKELESLKTDSPDYEQKKSELETKIKEASTRHKKHVQELYDEHWEQEFQLTCHFAEQELNELFVNEKYDFLKSTVKPKLKELEKEYYRLSNKFKMTHVFNVEYCHTFMKMDYFFHIDNWFNDVVLNVIEPPVNVSDSIETVSEEIPELFEIELKTQKEQLRLLYDLGVIEFLQNKYPASLKDVPNKVAILLSSILKLQRQNIQPTVNALLSGNANSKNYPCKTSRTNLIIKTLDDNELK